MSKSYDLSTSTKWASLAEGNHQVTLVAKSSTLADSVHSKAVTVIKAILSGKYTFENTLTAPASMISEDVKFNVTLNNFTGECTNISLMPSTGVMNFTQSTGDTVMIYNFTTNTWNDLTSRKIDFGATSISVSSAFYTWLEANAHQTKTYNITNTLTNVTADTSNVTAVEENSSVTLRFTANTGYALPDTVTVTGATHTWDKTTGVVIINNPTANVGVTITGVTAEVSYTVNYEISGDAKKGIFMNGTAQGTLTSGVWTPSGNISAHIMNTGGSASGTFTNVKTLHTGFCDDATLLSEGLKIYTADRSSSVTIDSEKWKSHYADTKNFDLTSYLSEGCHIVWDGDT